MGVFAALDVSQEQTAICMVGQDGAILAEAKVPTCPETIANWLAARSDNLERVGWKRARWPSGCGTPCRRGRCRSSAWMRATQMGC